MPALYLKRPVRQYEEIVHDGPVIVRATVETRSCFHCPCCKINESGCSALFPVILNHLTAGRHLVVPHAPAFSQILSPLVLPSYPVSFPTAWQVFGDVCAGAVVRASGDIIVLGRLAGKAHAGAAIPPASSSLSPSPATPNVSSTSSTSAVSMSPRSTSSSSRGASAGDSSLGPSPPRLPPSFNRQSVVVALEMRPSVIAVASEVVAGPGDGEAGEQAGQPEVARLADSGGIW